MLTTLATTDAADPDAMAAAIVDLLARRDPAPAVVGLTEPTHASDTPARLRNAVCARLLAAGAVRTVAIESDRWAGRTVDRWVRGGPGDLDAVCAVGFSHEFGTAPANRDLLAMLRTHNTGRGAAEQVGFVGFDLPTELMWTPSPRPQLTTVHEHLAGRLPDVDLPCTAAELDAALGPEEPWRDEAGAWDPAAAVAHHRPMDRLRAWTDDLALLLDQHGPTLVSATGAAAHAEARLAVRLARWVLAAHVVRAGGRWSALGALRDRAMADLLLDLPDDGPVLVFAHHAHLRRGPVTMDLGPMTTRWLPAGVHLAQRLGPRYVVVATAVGRAAPLGLGAPEPDTVEGVLDAVGPGVHLVDAREPALRGRRVRSTDPRLVPVDAALPDEVDAVVYLPELDEWWRDTPPLTTAATGPDAATDSPPTAAG